MVSVWDKAEKKNILKQWYYMEVGGQFQSLATLPLGKGSLVPIG